jgi:hypothetical protein
VDLDVAIVAVGLARKEAFEFAFGSFAAQRRKCRLGILDDAFVVLGLTQLDKLDRIAVVLLDTLIAFDQVFESGSLAGNLLRFFRIVPEVRVLDFFVQFGKAPVRDIPVKDASVAGKAISGCRRRPLGFPRALLFLSILVEPACTRGRLPGLIAAAAAREPRTFARYTLQALVAILLGTRPRLVGKPDRRLAA